MEQKGRSRSKPEDQLSVRVEEEKRERREEGKGGRACGGERGGESQLASQELEEPSDHTHSPTPSFIIIDPSPHPHHSHSPLGK